MFCISFVFLFIFINSVSGKADLYFNSREPGCDGSDPNVLWCDDFEDGDWIVTNCDQSNNVGGDARNDGWCGTIYYEPDPEGTNFGRCGSKGAGGTNCAAGSGPHRGIGSAEMGDHDLGPNRNSYDEIYFRYYIKPLPGYVFGHEKMLTVNTLTSGGIYFGTTNAYFGSGQPTFINTAEDTWRFQNRGNDITLLPGNWYYIENHYRLNTPGQKNGVYEMWADNCNADGRGCAGTGTLRAQHTNIMYRVAGDNSQIGNFWLENWANAESIGEEYYDQIKVSKVRVGLMGNISSAPDINPPSLSNPQPSGTLPSGTTSTTIRVTTNENANCKFSTTANVAYSSMTNTFTTTGTTSHSTLLTGLSNGNSYTRYVKCQDTSGNANANDFTVTFSISSSVGICAQTLNSGGNIAAAVSNVASGSTICLNAGSYPAFSSSITKSSMTTITAAPGVSQSQVTIASVDVGSSQNLRFSNMTIGGADVGTGSSPALHIYFVGIKFTGPVCINNPTNINQDTLVDSSAFAGLGQGCTEGRLGVNGRDGAHTLSSGIVISNNIFGPGGCSDGIQIIGGARGVQILNNEFTGIKQGSCSPVHADPIQFYGALAPVVIGNYFHGSSTGIMGPGCGDEGGVFRNNIFVTDGEYPNQIVAEGSNVGTYDHNTFANGANIRFGNIWGCGFATNAVVTNNIFSGGLALTEGQGTSSFTYTNNNGAGGSNVIIGTPTYIGGALPNTWAGFQLSAGSIGKNAASDGKDIGANYFGTGSIPPPSDTTPPSTPTLNSPTVISSSQINFQWSPSTDAESGISGYNIYRCSGSSACTPTLLSNVGNVNSYSNTGLTPNTIYRYQVSAVNGVSLESIKSSIQTATTPQQSTNTITIGETNILTSGDNANANLLLAQQATLSQTATIQSLSFYVTTASGKLRLGIYDSTGPNSGPGTKKAETNEITPNVGWNTANVITPVSLPAGTYWLAYLPNDNNLAFAKGDGPTSYFYTYNYGAMPTTFSTVLSSTTSHWSLYATLTTGTNTNSCSWDFFPREIPDGKVTLGDVLVVVGDFGKTSASPGFNSRMDFNNNNQIDLFDVLSVVAHFGGC